ncbi:MAG TPA: IPT/TIG domain-containing protein [Bryobacteraceae bacterium]|jgi:uncharacterized protein (TIGR03437 family)|nr:IPT/TIG domain-containing protein [Bryobacteraceae bacterium]
MRLISIALLSLVSALCAAAQTPTITEGGVLNGASFAKGQAVSPGELVSIFGTDLASSTAQADSVPLSTTLANVNVSFNGVAAPLLYVSPTQINAQMPWDALPSGINAGVADVVVTRAGVKSAAQMVQVRPSAPGIFSIPPGAGYAIAINADGSVAAPPGAIPGIATRPAKVGDVIMILATGLGPVDSPISNGAASSDKLRRTTTTPVVLIGGQPAQVLFSGLSPQFTGVNQVNVVVPDVTAGDKLPLQMQMDGVTTTDQVVIAVTR